MSYKLERFGTLTLPIYNPSQDVGVGPARAQLQDLPGGGVFDLLGSERASPGAQSVSRQGTIHGDDLPMLAELRALKAKIGSRDRLFRRAQASGEIEWSWARLVNVRSERGVGDRYMLDVDIDFSVISPTWYGSRHGDGWLLDAGEYLDAGLDLDEEGSDVWTLYGSTTNVVINNGGNAIVKNAILRIIPGSAPITAVTVSKSGQTEITYTGTINPSQVLEIDCGAWSVKNNGVDDYDGLTYGSGHVIDGLLRLDPGANTIGIVKVGGNIDDRVIFEFCDGWQ